MPETVLLNLSQIRINGGTQPRCEISEATVKEYADAIDNDEKFPPVVVFYDGVSYWLADGFHRFFAYTALDIHDIVCIVHNGTKRDAVLYSLGANTAHGLRRTNEDKRAAVEAMLADEEWSTWSDRHIAKHCGVSNHFVAKLRPKTDATGSDTRKFVTSTGKIATHVATPNSGNIPTVSKKTPVTAQERGSEVEDETQPEPTDHRGTALINVPHVARAFEDDQYIEAAQRAVQQIGKQVDALTSQPVGAYLNKQQLRADLKNVYTALKFARPFALCPYCDGKKCGKCRQTGFMPENTYNLVPDRP